MLNITIYALSHSHTHNVNRVRFFNAMLNKNNRARGRSLTRAILTSTPPGGDVALIIMRDRE